jgi:hypothetical protein
LFRKAVIAGGQIVCFGQRHLPASGSFREKRFGRAVERTGRPDARAGGAGSRCGGKTTVVAAGRAGERNFLALPADTLADWRCEGRFAGVRWAAPSGRDGTATSGGDLHALRRSLEMVSVLCVCLKHRN